MEPDSSTDPTVSIWWSGHNAPVVRLTSVRGEMVTSAAVSVTCTPANTAQPPEATVSNRMRRPPSATARRVHRAPSDPAGALATTGRGRACAAAKVSADAEVVGGERAGDAPAGSLAVLQAARSVATT